MKASKYNMAKDKGEKKVKKVRNTANRLTQADKIAKRLKGVSAKTGFKAKSAQFNVSIFARSVVDINGFIVSDSGGVILFRHKRTNASKRMLVSRIPACDLVQLFGAVGEYSSATVIRETLVREVSGKIVEDNGQVLTLQTASGETVKIYQNANTRIEVSVEDDAGDEAGSSKKSKKSKGDKADGGKKKSKKSKKSSDDEDDDLDD
jgi:hypothetical protein